MVSIIVPYNKDRGYLDVCLRSIYAQNYSEIEVLEVKNDLSVAKNINIGLKKAKGEFFKYVCEDDWLPLDSTKNLVEGIGDHPWICANAWNVSGGVKDAYVPLVQGLTFKNMVLHNAIHGGTTLYRTGLLREIGGMNESLWTGEEYEMNLRLMSHGYLPGYIDKFVYYHRLWGQQKSRIYRKQNKPKRDEAIKRIQSLYTDKV